MSTEFGIGDDRRTVDARAVGRRLVAVLFGDCTGAFVFFVALSSAMVLWRFQISINDTIVLANGVAALADGHLHITEWIYGPSNTPGVKTANGRPYPHAIGLLVFSLPFLLLIRLLTSVMALQVMGGMLWSLCILGAFVTGGAMLGAEREGRLIGAVVAPAVFAITLVLAEPVSVDGYAHAALQMSTMILAGLTAVLLYRVCKLAHSRRLGLTVGLGVGLATPALAWATIPKRHVPMAALATVSLYFLYRSRAADARSAYRWFRMLAYVPVGLSAWVFVLEGALLFVALAGADLVTAREHSVGTLVGVGAALALSFIPFFVTNYLIAGNPLVSPRMLPNYTPGVTTGDSVNAASESSTEQVRGAQSDSPLPVLLQQMLYVLAWFRQTLEALLFEPDRVARIFVRSSWTENVARSSGPRITVSFLESMPVAGALVALPVVAVRRLRRREFDPIHAADAFVIGYAILTILAYIRTMPGHAQFTVRYLYVLFPFAAYGVARLPAVRAVIESERSLLGWTYAGGVLIGSQAVLAGLLIVDAASVEVIHGFASVGFMTGLGLGIWSLGSTLTRPRPRVGAVVLGAAAAAGTNFLVVTIIYHLGTNFALPVVPNI